jgi:hypothetical protein
VWRQELGRVGSLHLLVNKAVPSGNLAIKYALCRTIGDWSKLAIFTVGVKPSVEDLEDLSDGTGRPGRLSGDAAQLGAPKKGLGEVRGS